MTMPVIADTITQITASAHFAGVAVPPPPSVGTIMDTAIKSLEEGVLSSQLKSRRLHDSGMHPDARYVALARQYARVSHKKRIIKTLDRLFEHPPEDTRFVPVYYLPPGPDTEGYCPQMSCRNQFYQTVSRPRLSHIARTAPHTLRWMGVRKRNIEELKQGKMPLDPGGRRIPLTLDHVISLNGGGEWCTKSARDRDLPELEQPTFLINHSGNVRPLWEGEHAQKNRIVEPQIINALATGEPCWITYPVHTYTPFVAPWERPAKPQRMKPTTCASIGELLKMRR